MKDCHCERMRRPLNGQLSATPITRTASSGIHNLCASLRKSIFVSLIIGASLSEPHREVAVKFALYKYMFVCISYVFRKYF